MRDLMILCLLLLLPAYVQGQVIITMAGGNGAGFSGDGGPAKNAQLYNPYNIAIDGTGNLYIADGSNIRIRIVNTQDTVETIAGSGAYGCPENGWYAGSSPIGQVDDIAFKGRDVYFASSSCHCIRRIDTTGKLYTVAGTGSAGYSGDGGPALTAMLNHPTGLLFGSSGDLYVIDALNSRIRKVDTAGVITTIAGTGVAGFSPDGGRADTAKLNTSGPIRKDKYGNLYFNDNNRIRKIDMGSGLLTTVAGNGISGYSGDGVPATTASIVGAFIAFDTSWNLLMSEGPNHRIRMVDQDGIIHTIAGTGGGGYSGDEGDPLMAHLAAPAGIVVDAKNNVYFADEGAHAIREITLDTPTVVQSVVTETIAFSVFPNPNAGNFAVLLSSHSNTSAIVSVTDLTGKTLRIYSIVANKETELDAALPKGLYLLQVIAGQYSATQKLLIH